MSAERQREYNTVCALMRNRLVECDLHIKETEENSKKLGELTGLRDTYKSNVVSCQQVIDSLKPMIEDVQSYITDKRKDSKTKLNNALRVAGEIVPAAVNGIKFEIEGDEAWLQTPNGAYVDRSEGSGYKGTTSVLLRSIVLAANPDKLQTMFLDEPFAKLSNERTALLSQYLPILLADQQVILIEQKKEIYANADCTLYGFFKSDNYTTIIKE